MTKIKLDTLFFHWIGEPFLHKRYSDMLGLIGEFYLKNKIKFKAVETHTNGSLLNSEIITDVFNKFNDSFPWILSFSIDAVKKKSYKKIGFSNTRFSDF